MKMNTRQTRNSSAFPPRPRSASPQNFCSRDRRDSAILRLLPALLPSSLDPQPFLSLFARGVVFDCLPLKDTPLLFLLSRRSLPTFISVHSLIQESHLLPTYLPFLIVFSRSFHAVGV